MLANNQAKKDVGLKSVPIYSLLGSCTSRLSYLSYQKHYEDFVMCEEADTATHVKELRQKQWENLI